MTSSKIFKRGNFCGTKILYDRRSEIVAGWHLSRILQRDRALSNSWKVQISNFGDRLRKVVYLKRSTDGGLGAEPPAARGFGGLGAKPPAVGRFFLFFGKKSYFNAIESHFARFQSYLKALNFWNLKPNWKDKITWCSFNLQFKSKIRLTSCILVLNFNCKWLGPGRGK